MTDTPETDGEWNRLACQDHPEFERNLADFARKLERERDEWHFNALLKLAVKKLACMWCGEIVHAPTGYDPGTPLSEEQRGQAYREHVATCQKHPVRDVERERDEIRAQLREEQQLHIQTLDERDEWKAKYIQQNKDLGCEQMDPNGTIWDHAKKLEAELDEARAAIRGFTTP